MARQIRRGSPSGKVALEVLTVARAMGNAGTATVTAVTMTVTGLLATDLVVVNASANLAAGLGIAYARPSAANELTVALVNPTAAQVAAGTMTFSVVRFPINN